MSISKEKYSLVRQAMDFLNDHPALNNSGLGSFFFSWAFWISEYCVHGVARSDMDPADVTVRYHKGTEGFDQWVKEYDDTRPKIPDLPEYDYVEVPYEKVWKVGWEFHHTCWNAEFSIYQHSEEEGPPPAFQGGFVSGDSFEDVVLACAELAKNDYGDYSSEDFYTEAERKNKEEQDSFLFVPIDETEQMYEMITNPDSIHVPWWVLNRRWWDWFKTTKKYNEFAPCLDEDKA